MAIKNNPKGVPGIRLQWWLFAVFAFFFCLFLVEVGPPRSPNSTDSARSNPSGSRPSPSFQESGHGGAPAQRRLRKSRPFASFTAEEVQALVCRMANEKAQDLYGCEPFSVDSLPRRVQTGWVWLARRALPNGDMEATVRLDPEGTVEQIDVLFLQSARGFE